MTIDRRSNEAALQRAIGGEVRRHRFLRRMRAASLARASGISPGMLSRIERGLISPSITSLKALADALHLPVSALFASFDDAPAAIFTRADPTHAIGKQRGEGARCEVLGISGDSGNILKAQMILISSEQETYPELPTIGVLFVHLLTGGLTYSHGRDVFPMLPGDSLLFEAEIPHRIELVSAFPTKVLAVSSFLPLPLIARCNPDVA
jgi:transcriptional regulator with XRE-family HTH domain